MEPVLRQRRRRRRGEPWGALSRFRGLRVPFGVSAGGSGAGEGHWSRSRSWRDRRGVFFVLLSHGSDGGGKGSIGGLDHGELGLEGGDLFVHDNHLGVERVGIGPRFNEEGAPFFHLFR